MLSKTATGQRGFTLLEVVLVIVIIGIIAGLAIPRLSRGVEGANEGAVTGDVAVLNHAVELFITEHEGLFPAVATIEAQLTQYSNMNGETQETMDSAHIYGPYMREIPPMPIGTREGKSGIAASDGPTVGWIYNQATGEITANMPE